MVPIGTKYLQCEKRPPVNDLTIYWYHSKNKWSQLGPIRRLLIKNIPQIRQSIFKTYAKSYNFTSNIHTIISSVNRGTPIYG